MLFRLFGLRLFSTVPSRICVLLFSCNILTVIITGCFLHKSKFHVSIVNKYSRHNSCGSNVNNYPLGNEVAKGYI